MRKHLRRYAAGALTVGAIAGGAALGLPTQAAADWQPVTRGLSESPQQMLPATVSKAKPVRVVSTSLAKGKPVVKVTTATDRTTAAQLVKAAQKAKGAIGVELDTVVTALDVPTGADPYSGQQWDLPKIRVADAWQRSTGAGVTVAVIDTGVDATHPDLAGQVLPGTDLITDTSGVGTDPNGHGTHVAGTIAALTGNGVGVSSIAPDTRILPVRVLDANGSGYSSDTAAGIIYAADHGANIINMSLGGAGQATAVTNAIAYARGKGVTVIAAAGNQRSSGSPVSYPGADPGVIAVAATDSNDSVASYSNQGSYVDVAAPGSSILSTVPGARYAIYSGTSMATPHVVAVAALLKAYNPALTPDGIEKALESSAVDLGAKGKDNDFGYGRIDAVAALDAAAPTTSAPVATSPSTAPSSAVVTPTPSKTSESPKPTATVTPSPSKTVTPTPTKTVTPTPTKTVTPTPTKTVTPTPTKTVTPTPTKTVPKVAPVIKVAPAATTVGYGGTATVTYTVLASGKPFAGKPVKIGTAAPGSTFTFTEATTNASGVVSFTQKATAHVQVKLLVPGTETTLEATSPVTAFTVKTLAVVSSPAKGSLKLVLTGATGQPVLVQRLERGIWKTAQVWTASTTELKLTGLTSAAQYRVVVPATSTLIGLTSSTVKIV